MSLIYVPPAKTSSYKTNFRWEQTVSLLTSKILVSHIVAADKHSEPADDHMQLWSDCRLQILKHIVKCWLWVHDDLNNFAKIT